LELFQPQESNTLTVVTSRVVLVNGSGGTQIVERAEFAIEPPEERGRSFPVVLGVESVEVDASDTASGKIVVQGSENFVNIRSNEIVLLAKIVPDIPEVREMITWESDDEIIIFPAIGSDKRTARISANSPKKITMQVKLNDSPSWTGFAWFVWANVQIRTTGTLDAGNDASGLEPGPEWPTFLGGGNGLGAVDVEQNTNFTHGAYASWRMEIKAELEPVGIEQICPEGWKMRRAIVSQIEWENAGSYDAQGQWQNQPIYETHPPLSEPDDSQSPSLDEDPTSGVSVREVFDIDVPGTPQPHHHTREKYVNFEQWVEIQLPQSVLVCSEFIPWSYVGRVDVDKVGSKIDLNVATDSHVNVPGTPYYSFR